MNRRLIYALLATGLIAPAASADEKETTSPQVVAETSSVISIFSSADGSVLQEVGGPLAAAVLVEGDAQVLQGLFAMLEGNKEISGVEIIDGAEEKIAFDPATMTVHAASGIKNARLMVVDFTGVMVKSAEVPADGTSTDLSGLPAGAYIAAITSNNKIYKTLKFIVK